MIPCREPQKVLYEVPGRTFKVLYGTFSFKSEWQKENSENATEPKPMWLHFKCILELNFVFFIITMQTTNDCET